MRRTLVVVVCFVLAGLALQSARADMINGQFVPHELVGTYLPYRLIFVTDGDAVANQTTTAYYDTFVQTQADLNPLLAGMNSLYQWQAVVTVRNGATPLRSAPDVLQGSAPIYNFGNGKVGDNGADMLDGDLDAAVLYDQFFTADETLVWTGGTSQPGSRVTPSVGYYLGTAPYPPGGEAMSWVGRSWSAGSDWILDTQLSQVVAGQPRRLALYAISGELTAVPEPSTIVLWGVFTGIAGLVFWRKRRQGN